MTWQSTSNTPQTDCRQHHHNYTLLQALERWEPDWLMEFHPDKYPIIRISRKKTIHRYPYTLHGHILAEVTHTHKYLLVLKYISPIPILFYMHWICASKFTVNTTEAIVHQSSCIITSNIRWRCKLLQGIDPLNTKNACMVYTACFKSVQTFKKHRNS